MVIVIRDNNQRGMTSTSQNGSGNCVLTVETGDKGEAALAHLPTQLGMPDLPRCLTDDNCLSNIVGAVGRWGLSF
jgi:hypothetical protein